MALTEEEKRMARAYNIGYLLSSYEPQLMEKIIKSNPKNEFVKAMQVGRDHHHFNVNMPRKDYNSQEFRNGFFNGRTLAEHDPKMIDNLLSGKGLHKDYKKGIEAARKEHEVLSIQEKMRKEPKAPERDLRNDHNYQKGFNIGYRLAGNRPHLMGYATTANERYSKYLDGMQAGMKQYTYDLEKLQDKNPDARIFRDDPQSANYIEALMDHNMMAMNEVSSKQYKILEQKETFNDVPEPKWLQKKTSGKDADTPQKDKKRGKDIDMDR